MKDVLSNDRNDYLPTNHGLNPLASMPCPERMRETGLFSLNLPLISKVFPKIETDLRTVSSLLRYLKKRRRSKTYIRWKLP